MSELPKTPRGVAARTLDLGDNAIAAEVYGPHNAHLDRLESLLGIGCAPRGNALTISGGARALDAAVRAVTGLAERARSGHGVEAADVEAAVRMIRDDAAAPDLALKTRKKTIQPRTPMQADYIRAMGRFDLVFGLGPAGTGKTYLAVAMAVSKYLKGEISRIVLSRPAVEAGENLGFLPGDLRDKVDPYLRPLYDALNDMMPADQVQKRIETGEIEIAPLAFMRGRTLTDAFVIVDEAQNTTAVQMKMLLTRLGEGSVMVVNGDLTQVDLPKGVRSGLRDALETLEGVGGVGVVEFTDRDVVRHGLVARIVAAYAARSPASPYEAPPGGGHG
ncbi:PhoH family protein [Oleispirillum naphthae]|uniref:PhoH family protein n=1 Tax=Oleispirillum naphthae TaxID=2838853 RepID=UPI0030823809